MRNEPERVEAYLAALPPDRRSILESVRTAIRSVAADAAEGIAYQMPAFYSDGRFLVSYAALKKHFSLFPASEGVIRELGEELRGHLSGSGTIQFTAEEPLSPALVQRITRIRLDETAAGR